MDELNDNDLKLLAFCLDDKKTISEIARHLNIAVKNVSIRLDKLLKLKKITITDGNQNKKYIRAIEGIKTEKYILEILKKLKEKGEMTPLEFHQIFSFWKLRNDSEAEDKRTALYYTEFSYPPLLEKVFRLSPEGLKFLKENENK